MAQANPKGPSNTHHSQQKKEGEKSSQMLKGSAVGLLRVRVGESGYILVRAEDTTHNILL